MSKLVAFAAIQGAYNIVSQVEGEYKKALETSMPTPRRVPQHGLLPAGHLLPARHQDREAGGHEKSVGGGAQAAAAAYQGHEPPAVPRPAAGLRHAALFQLWRSAKPCAT